MSTITVLGQPSVSTRQIPGFIMKCWIALQERRKRAKLRAELYGLNGRDLHDIGEVLAPLVSFFFWRVAMRLAVEKRSAALKTVVGDFRAPFSGVRGSWRLMSVLRFGKPAELLAAIPEMLPHLATVVDDICVVKSMFTTHLAHEAALFLMHGGRILPTRPSLGCMRGP